MKIIFLDIDGVLNGYNLRVHTQFHILKFLFPNKWRNIFDLFGIHIWKLIILWIIVKLTGAKIVMSSSWRYGFLSTPVDKMYKDKRKLYKWMKFLNILPIDITTTESKDRGLQILDWLDNNKHFDIKSFCVIDDEMFDIKPHIVPCYLLSTHGEENRLFKFKCCGCYDGAGLKLKHISKAVSILNMKVEKIDKKESGE